MATLAILARQFPPQQFGQIVLGQTGSNMVTLLTASWAGTAAIRYLSGKESPETRAQVYRHIRTLVWCQVVLMTIIGAALALSTSGTVRAIIVLSLVGGLPAALTVPSLHSLRASDRPLIFNALTLLRHVLPTAAGLCWISANTSSAQGYQVAYGVCLLSVVPLFELAATRRHGRAPAVGLTLSISKETMRKLVRFGLPLIPAYLLTQVLAFADRFMIAALKGQEAAGVYAAGYSMAALPIQFTVGALAMACGPEIVRAWEARGPIAARQVIAKWATFNLVVTGSIVLVLLVGASWISPVVLGSEFGDVSTIVRLVAFGELVIGVQWFLQRPLVLNETTSPILYGILAAAALNIGANAVLIPRYGIAAAGWTTIGSNLVYAAMIFGPSSRIASKAISK